MDEVLSTTRNKKTAFVITVIVLILVIAAGIYFMATRQPKIQEPEQESKAITPVVPETVDVVSKIEKLNNPVGDKLPDLNPVEKVNPFKDVYKNPFE